MSTVVPTVIRREQAKAKQTKIELRVNNNRILSLAENVSVLKNEQHKFSSILNRPFKPVLLAATDSAIKKLNQKTSLLKTEIANIKTDQSKLNNQLKIVNNKIEKLQLSLKLQKIIESETKDQLQIEEFSQMSGLNSSAGSILSFNNSVDSRIDGGNIEHTAGSMPLFKSNQMPVDVSVSGIIKLTESQSVSVDIQANQLLECKVAIAATKGIAGSIIRSTRDQLKSQVQLQGLSISKLSVSELTALELSELNLKNTEDD